MPGQAGHDELNSAGIPAPPLVIPAKAGIQANVKSNETVPSFFNQMPGQAGHDEFYNSAIPASLLVIPALLPVIPAKAGIHISFALAFTHSG